MESNIKTLILLMTFARAFQIVKGAYINGSVTCHSNNTVDIRITNVDDINEWNTTEWQLENSTECEPTFNGTTVTYKGLVLPNCSMSSEQLDDSIKYILQINVRKSNHMTTRAYNHLYYVSCQYDNQNRSTASFVPSHKFRRENDSSTGYFTFTLQAFRFSNHTGKVLNPIPLNRILYFKAKVESVASNLDLFPVHCWSSNSDNPDLAEGNFTLIRAGCGKTTVDDTLKYKCTNDSVEETFSIKSFRYIGASAGIKVYFHCDLRVCLADAAACECPSSCSSSRRKRRAVVDEFKLHHVATGPYIFTNDEEEHDEEAGEPQSLPTNLVVTVVVSGVAALAIICATAYLVVRSCNKRRQHGDLNVAT